MRWRRRVLWLGLLGAVAAAIVWGFMPRPVLVEAAQVTRGPLKVTIEEEGKTRLVERFVISAPVAGFARRIDLQVGDQVRRGQVLVQLDPLQSQVLDPRSRAEAQARVAAAEARLREVEEKVLAATATADYWRKELPRIRDLRERGVIPRSRMDEAETQTQQAEAGLRAARFAVSVARSELEAAQTALSYSAAQYDGNPHETVAVRVPVDGYVLEILHKSEGVVNAGQPLLEIGDPRALEVVVELLSADAVKIAPGTRVLFQRWGGGKPLEGQVRRVEPVGFTKVSALGVEEQRVLVVCDILSAREIWDSLGHGYRVEAGFILWEEENVLQVPASALFRHGEDWAVFVVEEGVAAIRPVEIGQQGEMNTQILSGLAEGELVITHPDETIEKGVQVRLLSD